MRKDMKQLTILFINHTPVLPDVDNSKAGQL